MSDGSQRRTQLVETTEALLAARSEWETAPAIGVDIESNSFFAYRERTCLLQVSTRDADWILDPFAVDLTPLASVFANPAIEKVLHASELDVVSLRRDYGFRIEGLYDTLVAAKAVGRKKVGLANLVEELIGVKLAKDEQRSDWGRRPLSKEQIEYAFADTRHLIQLAELLKADVREKGVEDEVAVDCSRMAAKEAKPREVDPEAFERHPSARALTPAARQVLRCLYLAREKRADETDKPPFRIVSDQSLGEIAIRQPRNKADLAKIPGVTPPVIQRHGDAFLAAVEEGIALGPLPFKRRPFNPPDPKEEERYEALRAWRRGVAERRGVEVDVIAGNAALKAIAKSNPRSVDALAEVPELDGFRRTKYGEAIVRANGSVK